jgi:outer membrane protein assembly factor BamB
MGMSNVSVGAFFRWMMVVGFVCGGGLVAEEWAHFLGPRRDGTTRETVDVTKWGEAGPVLVWEHEKGTGWAAPVVSNGVVVLFYRKDGEEVLEGVELGSGRGLWRHAYAAPYRDRYGAGDAPRTNPTVREGRVYVYGITGLLHCLELKTGKVIWRKDLQAEYAIERNFFGPGSSPLVEDGMVVVEVGGAERACLVAFDAGDGKERWVARHRWGASYSSPVLAEFEGKKVVLAFVGGESRPPTGGLIAVDAGSGAVLGEVAHRARIAESVNAATPVVRGGRILTSEGYGSGSVMSEWTGSGLREVWRRGVVGSQFGTPLWLGDLVVVVSGTSERLAEVVGLDAGSGEELWRTDMGGDFGRGSWVGLGAVGMETKGVWSVLGLSETGDLFAGEVSRKGLEVRKRVRLFSAPETWTAPVVAEGYFLVARNVGGRGVSPRILCYRAR